MAFYGERGFTTGHKYQYSPRGGTDIGSHDDNDDNAEPRAGFRDSPGAFVKKTVEGEGNHMQC